MQGTRSPFPSVHGADFLNMIILPCYCTLSGDTGYSPKPRFPAWNEVFYAIIAMHLY